MSKQINKDRFKDNFFSEFSAYKFSLFLFLLLCSIVFMQRLGFDTFWAIINVVSIYLLINLISKFKNKVGKILSLIILVVWLAFDITLSYLYSNYVTLGIMASIIETNSNEASSVMKDKLLPSLIITLITCILVTGSVNEFSKNSFSIKKTCALLATYLFLLIPTVTYLEVKQNKQTRENIYMSSQYASSTRFTLIYGDLLTLAAYSKNRSEIANYYKSVRRIKEGISLNKEVPTPEKIYLVIGESSSANYYSLYGYTVKTTPFLDSLATNDPNMKYYNGISPSVTTRLSIPFITTFSDPTDQDEKRLFSTKNIIELAKEAGYETFWISNQDRVGLTEGYITAIANSADKEYYEESGKKKDDLNLISSLNKEKKNGRKQFFIINLQGSHISFSDKYDEIDLKALPGKSSVDEYNRSIHHTDRFLRELHLSAKTDASSFLFYTSDHGEMPVKEGSRNTALYGKKLFYIPIVTYAHKTTSDYSSTIDKYIDKQLGFANLSNVPYILSEILGYHVSGNNVSEALSQTPYVIDDNWALKLFSELKH